MALQGDADVGTGRVPLSHGRCTLCDRARDRTGQDAVESRRPSEAAGRGLAGPGAGFLLLQQGTCDVPAGLCQGPGDWGQSAGPCPTRAERGSSIDLSPAPWTPLGRAAGPRQATSHMPYTCGAEAGDRPRALHPLSPVHLLTQPGGLWTLIPMPGQSGDDSHRSSSCCYCCLYLYYDQCFAFILF